MNAPAKVSEAYSTDKPAVNTDVDLRPILQQRRDNEANRAKELRRAGRIRAAESAEQYAHHLDMCLMREERFHRENNVRIIDGQAFLNSGGTVFREVDHDA